MKITPISRFAAVGQQLQDLGLYGDIQGGGGLVGDEQFWFVDQGHGDHHALAHAAGKLVGVIVDGGGGVANPTSSISSSARCRACCA